MQISKFQLKKTGERRDDLASESDRGVPEGKRGSLHGMGNSERPFE